MHPFLPFDKPIYLVGYPGVGKSTLGRRLSYVLDWTYIDTDVYLENLYHSGISSMVRTCGIEKFRKREAAALWAIAGIKRAVVSTGGGLPCHGDNMQRMLRSGVVVYLTCPADVLSERLYPVRETRPLVAGMTIGGIRDYLMGLESEREPYYAQAPIHIDTRRMYTPEDEERLVSDIVSALSSL